MGQEHPGRWRRRTSGRPAREREAGSSAALSRQAAEAVGFLSVGHRSYGEPQVLLYPGDTAKVRIGRYCSIANGATFVPGGNHRTDWVTTYPLRAMLELPGALTDGHPATKGDIVVADDVWLGAECRVLSGVTIGAGAVVGLAAVVTTDVRPYAVVAGNPAREVGRRFGDSVVEALLQIAWWEWTDEQVEARVGELCSPDIEAFIRRYA
jgi:acetyltransferase-like isoleucine patch superfamily enzyme